MHNHDIHRRVLRRSRGKKQYREILSPYARRIEPAKTSYSFAFSTVLRLRRLGFVEAHFRKAALVFVEASISKLDRLGRLGSQRSEPTESGQTACLDAAGINLLKSAIASTSRPLYLFSV